MASLTRWTWVWVDSGSWWWTGRPGVLQFMGSRRVGHDWATDLIWSERPRLCGGWQDHYHTAPVSLLQVLPVLPVILHTCLHDRFYMWIWLCAWSFFYHNTELRLVVLITDYLFKCIAIHLYTYSNTLFSVWASSMGITWARVRNADSHCSKSPRWCTLKLEEQRASDFSHQHPWGVSPTQSYW